jgi:hypothetical protein
LSFQRHHHYHHQQKPRYRPALPSLIVIAFTGEMASREHRMVSMTRRTAASLTWSGFSSLAESATLLYYTESCNNVLMLQAEIASEVQRNT